MKSVSINTGASEPTAIQSFQDGDIFRESNIDLQAASLADALGWLKAQLALKATLSGANTWTSFQTFQPDGAWGSEPLSALFYREVRLVTYATSPTEAATAGFIQRVITMADANETWNPVAEIFLVPQNAAARTYKFNSPSGGASRKIKIVRPRSVDAFAVTIQDGSSVTMGIISSSEAGFIELTYDTTSAQGWIVTGYGGVVTSLAEGVGP